MVLILGPKDIKGLITIKEAVDADDYFEARAWASESISLQGGMDKIFFYGYRLIGGGDGT